MEKEMKRKMTKLAKSVQLTPEQKKKFEMMAQEAVENLNKNTSEDQKKELSCMKEQKVQELVETTKLANKKSTDDLLAGYRDMTGKGLPEDELQIDIALSTLESE